MLVLSVGWMALAQVDRVVHAEGRVIPAGKAQIVQHLEGGIVTSMVVREGSLVKKGDLLVVIGDTRANSQLGERKIKIAALQARAARLRAEAEGAGKPDFKRGVEYDVATQGAEQALFVARRQKLTQETEIFQEQIRQKTAEISESENRRKSLEAELEIARHQLAIVTELIAKNAASRLELLEAQGRVQRLLTQTGEAESALPRLRAAIHEAEAKRGEVLARFRSEARAELSTTQMDIDSAGEGLRAESDRVTRTDIRSPVNGIVNRIYINTIGGVVKAGEPVMELTPTDERVVIEAQVRPNDRAELHSGLPANIKVGAYDFGIYGTLHGRLTEVSADTVSDERGNRFYHVELEVEAVPASYLDNPIMPGMPVTADIVTGRRTVLQYVLSPLSRFSFDAFREPR
ncbi:MAG: HlyD family type I secretion periplasmic adaptor subunit [Nitrosomonadales bacterium]|nr:HlyD family type I secretion periplasmic adaptor subunit [Nitrosomonadales bacterium]